MLITSEFTGFPVTVKSPTETSVNVPGWRFRIIMFPPVTSSKTALSPDAPAADEVALPPGRNSIDAVPKSTSVNEIIAIASIETDE